LCPVRGDTMPLGLVTCHRFALPLHDALK